jgi:hypothetical protein
LPVKLFFGQLSASPNSLRQWRNEIAVMGSYSFERSQNSHRLGEALSVRR